MLNDKPGIFSDLQPIPVGYGILGISLSLTFFTFIGGLIRALGPPAAVDSHPWKWKNVMNSWIHAWVVTLWNLLR